jgi:hypothetical protein
VLVDRRGGADQRRRAGPRSHDGTGATAVTSTVVVLALVALLLRLPAGRLAPWLVRFPLLGVAIVVVLDLGSHDAGVTGQVLLVLPVIWAAAHLRAAGTVVVAAASAAADAAAVLSVLPARRRWWSSCATRPSATP